MDNMNIKLFLLIILGAAALVLAFMLLLQRKRKSRPYRSSYIDALYALIDGRKNDALNLLTRAVKNGEGDVDAYLQLGNLLREKNQPEKALQIHRSLMVRRDLAYEEEKSIQLALAEDLASLGKIDKAIQTLEALEQRKKDPDTILTLHSLYHRSGDYEKAFSSLRDLSRFNEGVTDKKRASYLVTAAAVLRREGNTDDAKRYLDRALREDRFSKHALFLYGHLSMEDGDLETASRMWERLLQIDVEYFDDIIANLEKVLYESGKFQKMERILNDLAQRNAGRPSILESLASFYERKGERRKAIRLLEDEKDAVAGDPVASMKLVSLYLQESNYPDARKVAEGFDVNMKKRKTYRCNQCGFVSEVPLAYCDRCSRFDTFERNHASFKV